MTAWLGPYAGFIAGSYGAVAIVVALLVGWVVVDHRRQRRLLRDLDASGIVRRSGRKATDL